MDSVSSTPHGPAEPSPWVVRWAASIQSGARVLDVATGNGRHALLLAAMGFTVDAVDRDLSGFGERPANVMALEADLEAGPWPYDACRFGGIVVTNYLHRPLLPRLVDSLEPGGILIYETFAQGNERFGKPSNPAFLLAAGELLDAVRPHLRVLGYEDLVVTAPRPAAVQRIAARRE
jgi:SAM-dependent methyltransferase